MANGTGNNENNKVSIGIRLDADLNNAVAQLMNDERRPSMANTYEWLLATHPKVKKIMSAEPASVGAGN